MNQQTACQAGVIAPANSHALFITFDRVGDFNLSKIERFKQQLNQLPNVLQQMQGEYPDADLQLVFAIGSECWEPLLLGERPKELQCFQVQSGNGINMPSTPADILLHIRSERHDVNYKLALKLQQQWQMLFAVKEYIHGFRYLESRDLTGFVDGTENPQGESRAEVAVVSDDPSFNGGSYIHLQKYVHDLNNWQQQPVSEQEQSYGRTKEDNIEYPSTEKRPSAHTKRTSLKNAVGESIEILRHSMPFGNLQQSGLLFASYCANASHFNTMLQSMVNGGEDGEKDAILNYTQAVTGQAFFAPAQDWFARLN